MKNKTILIYTLMLALIGISCDNAKNPHHSPKSIVKAFAENLYTGHYDKAKEYVTPESIPIVEFFEYAFPPENFAECNHVTLDEITLQNTTDSTAICKYTIHLCTGKSNNLVSNVIKRDGKWYVTLRQGTEERNKLEKENVLIIDN